MNPSPNMGLYYYCWPFVFALCDCGCVWSCRSSAKSWSFKVVFLPSFNFNIKALPVNSMCKQGFCYTRVYGLNCVFTFPIICLVCDQAFMEDICKGMPYVAWASVCDEKAEEEPVGQVLGGLTGGNWEKKVFPYFNNGLLTPTPCSVSSHRL